MSATSVGVALDGVTVVVDDVGVVVVVVVASMS